MKNKKASSNKSEKGNSQRIVHRPTFTVHAADNDSGDIIVTDHSLEPIYRARRKKPLR